MSFSMHRDDQHLKQRKVAMSLSDEFDSVPARHTEIDSDSLRLEFYDRLYCTAGVPCLAYHIKAGLLERQLQTYSKKLVIVDNQYFRLHVCLTAALRQR